MSQFGRLKEDFTTIATEVVGALLSRCDPDRIEHVFLASYAPERLCGLSNPLGDLRNGFERAFPELRASYHGLFKTGGSALYEALENTHHGIFSGDVLVVGCEKMTHIDPARVAGILSERESPLDRAYGATLPALGALVTSCYMSTYEVPESSFHAVAVKNHRHAALNPRAHFRRPIGIEDVATSPLVADPLRRLHCAPTSDGAAGVVIGQGGGDVAFIGWGCGRDTSLFQNRRDAGRFVATAEAAHKATKMARLESDEIDVVEIHDAFSPFELINLEEMGFYPLGHSWKALDSGDLTIGGRYAVNPSGGMKAKGHPIGATGLSSTVEMCEQLTQSAGERQHPGARLGIIQSVGGVSPESYVFALEAT